MKKYLLFLFVLSINILSAQTNQNNSNVNWDLSIIYVDESAWSHEKEVIAEEINSINRFKGIVGKDALSLADALDAMRDLRTRAAKMYLYGILLFCNDENSEDALRKYDTGTALESKVESAVSFIEYEVSRIDKKTIDNWMKTEPRLKKHLLRIYRILSKKEHLLNPESQKIVESMTRWPRLSIDVYEKLMLADLGWQHIKINNEDVAADQSEYFSLMHSTDKAERTEGIRAYLNKLKSLQDVFALLLTRRVEADQTIAKNRNFDNAIDALWFLRDGMPVGSAEIMIDVAKKNLNTLHRYIKLKKEMLGLDNMEYPDLNRNHTPDRQISLEESKKIIIESTALFGNSYQQKLKERLSKPWYSLLPSQGKGSNYGIFPAVDGIPPYTIMSFRNNISSSSRFAGAAALVMAFANISEISPPDTRDDPGIHSNAIIYVGNMLHYDYLISQTKDKNEKAAYLMEELDLIARRFFKWVMFSDFDQKIQSEILNGNSLTGTQISEMYLKLLKEYYGRNNSVMNIDDIYAYDWMDQGILFLSYEDQFWPPAIAAALMLYEKAEQGDQKTIDFFNTDYGLKDSDRSFGMLKTVDIDMSTDEPYLNLIQVMNSLMDKVENLRSGEE